MSDLFWNINVNNEWEEINIITAAAAEALLKRNKNC
jgi:hypothetical protein